MYAIRLNMERTLEGRRKKGVKGPTKTQKRINERLQAWRGSLEPKCRKNTRAELHKGWSSCEKKEEEKKGGGDVCVSRVEWQLARHNSFVTLFHGKTLALCSIRKVSFFPFKQTPIKVRWPSKAPSCLTWEVVRVP